MFNWEFFKPDKERKVGKQILVLGKKGCGKSYFTKELLKKYPNHIVVDINKEYQGFKRYIPSNFDSNSLVAEFDLLMRKIIVPHKDKIDLLVIEEADMILPNKADLSDTQRALINLNRHWGLCVVMITRRPALINTNVPALADAIICFKLDDVNDLDRIGRLHPDLITAMPQVNRENHEFVFYDGVTTQITKV